MLKEMEKMNGEINVGHGLDNEILLRRQLFQKWTFNLNQSETKSKQAFF